MNSVRYNKKNFVAQSCCRQAWTAASGVTAHRRGSWTCPAGMYRIKMVLAEPWCTLHNTWFKARGTTSSLRSSSTVLGSSRIICFGCAAPSVVRAVPLWCVQAPPGACSRFEVRAAPQWCTLHLPGARSTASEQLALYHIWRRHTTPHAAKKAKNKWHFTEKSVKKNWKQQNKSFHTNVRVQRRI